MAFPAILLPCFIALALLLAILLRKGCPDLPRRYRDMLTASWCVFLVAVLAAAGIYSLRQQIIRTEVSIEADMLINRGTLVELFLNDLQLDPYRQLAVPGQRHVYRYEKLPHEITLLRFDPTEQADARIVIYSITVKSGNQVFRKYGPSEIKNWTLLNLSTPKEEAGALVMTDATDDPILWTSPALRLPGAGVAKLATLVDDSDGPFLLAMAAFLLVLLTRASTRAGRLQAVQIAVACCVGFPIVWLVNKLALLPPPVTVTVGYASYNGYAKTNDILAGVLMMLVSIGLGYGCATWVDRGPAEPEEPKPEENVSGRASKRSYIWLTHAAVIVLAFLFFLPNLLEILQSMSRIAYRNDSWDAANTLLWGALINKGLLPYRDFWYPYGGFYVQLQRFPAGHIWGILHCTVIVWFLFLGLLRITGRRLIDTLMIFGVILVPLLLGIMGGWHRYLMPIDVVLLYAAICDVPRLEWKSHLPFAALAGYVCFSEPPQLVCAACGILVHTGLTALSRFRGPSLRERAAEGLRVLKQRLVLVGVPMLAGAAVCALIYASNGMLSGIWDFEKSVADVGDYSAVPSEIAHWLLPALEPDTVFLLLFLVASYAAYRWVRMKGRHDPLGTAVLTVCVAGFVAMQKQIVRPHIMTQWRVYPYVALSILGLILWRERKLAPRIAIALFLGCLAGLAVHQNLLQLIFENDFKDVPRKVPDDLEVLLHDGKESAKANDSLFARARFASFDAQNAVVDNLTGACGLHPEDSVYVLGDDSLFYILLNQAPPYGSNSYNDSPIYEQQRVLEWIQRKNPRFVIWGAGTGPERQIFDSVPNMVRLPLIYTYIVANYKLLRAVGPFHILTKRAPDELPDLEYWRQTLGKRIDLGSVPRRARLSEYGACEGDKSRCDAVLVVRYPQPAPVSKGKLSITVESAAGPFQIQLNVAPGQREYVVNLNRIWFWNLLAKSGTPRMITEDERAQAFLGYHRERSPVLY